jgi:hypothetical protein
MIFRHVPFRFPKEILMPLGTARLLLLFVFAAAPLLAAQSELYDNGPINGDRDAWTINLGYAVGDSFTLTANSSLNELQFGSWLYPGDVIESVEVSITSAAFGGTTYFDQQVNFTQSGCYSNHEGLLTCLETGFLPQVQLAAGNYWVNLQNAVVNTGDPVYWDENSGWGCHSPGCPSQASENQIGEIPSESFTILGSSTTQAQAPEPGGLALLGSGVLGIAGWRSRKRTTRPQG